MVPNQLPRSSKEPTEEMRRVRALKRLRTALYLAVERLNVFLSHTQDEDIIRRLHTAKTRVETDDESTVVDYYTVWSDFADMRLTADGKLLRSDHYPEKYAEARAGVDKSHRVSWNELTQNAELYDSIRLTSLVGSLEKFLQARDEPDAPEV